MNARWRDSLSTIRTFVLDLLFPPYCVGCGREGSLLCTACLQMLRPLSPPFCNCGCPLETPGLCPHCSDTPLAIDGIRSAFPFQGLIREAVHQLKYRGISSLAKPLSELLHQSLKSHALPADVLVPVPLHGRRLRQRGYNQSHLLAAALGRRAGIDMADKALVRTRPTLSQAQTADIAGRRANVREAFACADHSLSGVCVLLIDDVCTTGATLEACAVALREGGAASVWGLTLAREL